MYITITITAETNDEINISQVVTALEYLMPYVFDNVSISSSVED